jgi:Tol biopolymer transport system component
MAAAASPSAPRLAYTGEKGNIFIATPQSGQPRQLTWSWEEPPSGEADTPRLSHVWPSWSPGGSRLACFGLRGTAGPDVRTSLYTIAPDGIESWELASISGGMPIYGNWSPRADAFTALIQREEAELSLEIAVLGQPGEMTPVLRGAPLFWSWSPSGQRLAAHVGSRAGSEHAARVVLIDVASRQIIREISNRPGDFRVPAWSPTEELLVYVERQEDGGNMLRLFDVRSGQTAPVAALPGSVAAVWSADGQALAFGSTARPGSLLFSALRILDLSTGRIASLLDEADRAITGFFWSPRGDGLLYLSVDVRHSHLRWHQLSRPSGETRELVRFLPSREQTFIFSFFDQYAGSHPPVAPDGSALAFAGHRIGPVALDTGSPARVYVVSLDDTDAPPAIRAVGAGNFVCWETPGTRI